ncbi:MAG: hypothetical protein QOF85_1838 [Solirubrobacterales bacterium]|jgi:hypothetical protein|nr:hypothetical protein [Solirubrobacterales bacterium]
MGSGRVLAAGCALAALALATAGCGAEESANEPRPQPPTRVSVTVTPRGITVQPPRIAIGPEPTQQIPQNQHASQPQVKSKEPVDVVFVTANLTDFDSKLEVRGPKDVKSGALVANGNNSLLALLPTGVYRVSAADIPRAKPVRFTVGPYRSSSENDLLLP